MSGVGVAVQGIGTWATTSGYAVNRHAVVARKRDSMNREPEVVDARSLQAKTATLC